MKRLLLKLGLFVLAAAIVNVAVAWGCAAFVPLRSSDRVASGVTSPTSPSWIAGDFHRFGHRRIEFGSLGAENMHEMFKSSAGMADPALIARLPSENRTVPAGCYQQCFILLDEAGWPMLAGSAEHANIGSGEVTRFAVQLSPADSTATDIWPHRFLPIRPIWPGFAINTLFYAVILSLLFTAPGFVRRRRRIKRGLCPACAYPVGESETCTECGRRLIDASS
ncbi:MAG: hypothetical protein L0Y44_16255 [Phycisphaerales bacterium]|nr:hypothetical protein [Phycisphaerales bacterium]MCI0676269.1 hypothetical protein [Phycisphaerales bacterium]